MSRFTKVTRDTPHSLWRRGVNPTFTLEEIGLRDAPYVGEEAASLGEILRAGAPVSTAFVVPTTFYAEYLNYPTVKSALDECRSSNPEGLRTQLLGISFPRLLEHSLRSSYRALSGPRDTFVSVRRSLRSFPSLRGNKLCLQPCSLAGIRADTGEQKVSGEEELIYSIKRFWAEHLAQLCAIEENFSLNPLPILVQQIEIKDIEGRLFTSDPYSADPGVVVVEIEHYDGFDELTTSGKERFFLEKGTDRLTKRMVTGMVEEDTSLEFVSSLSLWAEKIERLLGSPQELRWSSYQKVPTFCWIKPLYLRERVSAAAKLWVRVGHAKEAIPSGFEGIVTSNVEDAVGLAKTFSTKPVLLMLETLDEDKFATVRRARHKERRTNLHLTLPPARTVDGLREMKKALASEGLPRGPRLKYYLRVSFPANVVLLDRFLELEVDGVIFDAKHLTQGLLGTQEPVEADDSLFWALSKVQQECKKTGLDLLYLADTISTELFTDLLQKGVTQIIVNTGDEGALPSILAAAEERMLAAGGGGV